MNAFNLGHIFDTPAVWLELNSALWKFKIRVNAAACVIALGHPNNLNLAPKLMKFGNVLNDKAEYSDFK